MSNKSDLKGKIAIITGGARGIGKEISLVLADSGVKVVIVDINTKNTKGIVKEIKNKQRGIAIAVNADVSLKQDVDLIMKETMKQFGTIDILINNAGICDVKNFEDITENEWDKIMAVNMKGPFLCSQAVLPIMKAKNSGSIVNITSLAAKTGGPRVGVHYTVSKSGLVGLTKHLALYAGKYGIRVNAVSPGFIETEMLRDIKFDLSKVPLGRLGTPTDVAKLVHFLVSDESEYISGEIIDLDGGFFPD